MPSASTPEDAGQHPNARLVERFYTAFDARNADTMLACYHSRVTFRDPVFGELSPTQARAMWRMLTAQGKDLHIQASNIEADEETGKARWLATYTYPATGRTVRNKIHARFRFRDGQIIEHTDSFSLWRWSGMALGAIGWLTGWTPMVRKRIRKRARRALERHQRDHIHE